MFSSSISDLPTFISFPFKNVNAIAPTIIILSTFSIKLDIIPILSDTFAPPNIIQKGFSGLFNKILNLLISSSTKKPTALSKYFETPVVDAALL